MKELNTIFYFDIDDYEFAIRQIEDMDYKIYYINGERISTIDELFVCIKDRLPLDPPLSGNVNFDAFVDSLWGGLDNQDYEKIVIFWQYPNELMKQDKKRFEKLIQCINEVAKELLLEQYGVDNPIILKTFLFGKGAMFSKFCI
ncbi:barstar family protein [Clostridium sp. Marseille-Q2269]|uniref:barstar family protein n=1 Tax=Clostridium sp. Marseille-Q2269 TaxID=2942205 RepID=UPI0020733ADE|nr:barstar family protein [Clostridium sp. Marseille-Q2269]